MGRGEKDHEKKSVRVRNGHQFAFSNVNLCKCFVGERGRGRGRAEQAKEAGQGGRRARKGGSSDGREREKRVRWTRTCPSEGPGSGFWNGEDVNSAGMIGRTEARGQTGRFAGRGCRRLKRRTCEVCVSGIAATRRARILSASGDLREPRGCDAPQADDEYVGRPCEAETWGVPSSVRSERILVAAH